MELLSMAIFRRQLAETAARLLIFFTALALLTCPFLLPQNTMVIYFGIFDLLMAVILWYLIWNKTIGKYASHAVIAMSFLSVMPLVYVTGGVNSHFIFLIPISPTMTGLLVNARAAHWVAGVLAINIILLVIFDQSLPDLENFTNDFEQTRIRGYWLIMATAISSIFVHYYDRFNNHFNTHLRDLAFHDTLTKIPNRRSIQEALKLSQDWSWRKGTWLTVMMLDIDHFKQLNDEFGHDAGDQCLVEVARCLKKNVRRDADIVARYGGEEFVAIFPGVDNRRLRIIAETIRAKIENLEIKSSAGKTIKLTVTIGCCCREGKDKVPASEMLVLADKAMYTGKNQGRNQIVVAETSSGSSDQN